MSRRGPQLTPTTIRRLLEAKTDSGLAAGTGRHIHGLVRNALAGAEREERVHRNVAKLVRPPALSRPERRALTFEEAKRLLAAIEEHPLEALWVCAITVGLRRSELLGLRWVDVDQEQDVVAVKQTPSADQRRSSGVPAQDRGLQAADPGLRADHEAPAPAPAASDRAQAGGRRAVGTTPGWSSAPGSGRRWSPGTWTGPGMPFAGPWTWDCSPDSDLRHALATFMIAAGSDPRTVMKILGHSQISLTMNTYAHVLPDVEREAIDRVARSLFG